MHCAQEKEQNNKNSTCKNLRQEQDTPEDDSQQSTEAQKTDEVTSRRRCLVLRVPVFFVKVLLIRHTVRVGYLQ